MSSDFSALRDVIVSVGIFSYFSCSQGRKDGIFRVARFLSLYGLTRRIIRIRLVLNGLLLWAFDFFFIMLFLHAFCRQGSVARARSAIYRANEIRLISHIRLFTYACGLGQLISCQASEGHHAAANVAIRLNRCRAIRIRAFVGFFNHVRDILSNRKVGRGRGFIQVSYFLSDNGLIRRLFICYRASNYVSSCRIMSFNFDFLSDILHSFCQILTFRFTMRQCIGLLYRRARLFSDYQAMGIADCRW